MLISFGLYLKKKSPSKVSWFSFLCGLSLVFAYAPFSLWWLPYLVLPLWFNQLHGLDSKSAFKQGYIFAVGWFASGISWVHVAIDTFGGMPLIVSVLLMILLCCYLAIYPALSCFLSSYFSKNKKLNLFLLPSFWMIGEYLRANVMTGFPWLSLGYTQVNGPLSGWAPVVGEIGINFILLLVCACATVLYQKPKQKLSWFILIIIVVASGIVSQKTWVTLQEKSVNVALIQGNIAQSIKWDDEQEWPSMLKYLSLSQENFDAEIVIWPESAITAVEPLAQEFTSLINDAANLHQSAIITGIINYSFESKDYFNSLIVVGDYEKNDDKGGYYYGNANRYTKYHLLPIGEFVPFQEWLRPLAPFFNLPMSSFTRGDYVQNNLVANGYHLLPLICFEIAFAEQLAANFTNKTDFIFTVSNDAWFGDSHGPHQHLEIAQMRALEFARPVLRTTNNGITAAINHQGSIIARIPQFKEAVLKADIELVSGITPYSQYPHLLIWLFLAISLIQSRYFYLSNPRK